MKIGDAVTGGDRVMTVGGLMKIGHAVIGGDRVV